MFQYLEHSTTIDWTSYNTPELSAPNGTLLQFYSPPDGQPSLKKLYNEMFKIFKLKKKQTFFFFCLFTKDNFLLRK